MTGLTPLYSLPYPTGSDRLDTAVTSTPQALAEAVESTIAGFGGIAAPGSWVAVTFASNWGNFGAGYQNPEYRKVGAQLFIRGLAVRSTSTATSPSTIFTLPVGFRPPADLVFDVDTSAGHARLDVKATGVVAITQATTVGSYVQLTTPPIWLD